MTTLTHAPGTTATQASPIVLLANSRKNSARCIAGKHVQQTGFGSWVRPIASRPGGGITLEDQRLQRGGQADVLDIVALPLAGCASRGYQFENRWLADGIPWVRQGRIGWRQLCNAVDTPRQLWLNGWHSRAGINDRMPVDNLGQIAGSLSLIGPLPVNLRAQPNQVRAHFIFGGGVYDLAVTDPTIEADYKARPPGAYRIDQAVLCLSLSEPFHGYAYKLVAALITPHRTEESE